MTLTIPISCNKKYIHIVKDLDGDVGCRKTRWSSVIETYNLMNLSHDTVSLNVVYLFK